MAVNSLLGALDKILEEDLSEGVRDSLPALDSLWKDLFTNSMGVTRDGIGRTFQVIHTFLEGLSGAIKWVTNAGPNMLMDQANTVRTDRFNATTSFPGMIEHATPGHFQKKVTLAKAMGNVIVPHDWIRLGQLDAAISSAATEVIRGAAKNIALAEINAWYAYDSSGQIGTVSEAPTFSNNHATNDRAVFAIKSGSIRNFQPGMMVAFHATASGASRTTNPVLVDSVRYVPDETNDSGGYGEVTIQGLTAVGTAISSAENLSTAGIASGDLIVRWESLDTTNAQTFGPFGPEYWLTDTGTVFNINLATYTQLQSVVKNVGGVLTEQIMNRYFGRFFQAYGMQDMPETIITSMGVTNAHVENSDGLGRFDRTGRPFVVADGFEMGAIPFTFNGMNMKWHVTAFMPSDSDITATSQTGGRLWGLKLRDQNIVRYVPPALPQAKNEEPFPSEVEFVYPLIDGVFKPLHDSSTAATTNFQEAPFYRHVAYAPKVMQGIKLTGLTESI